VPQVHRLTHKSKRARRHGLGKFSQKSNPEVSWKGRVIVLAPVHVSVFMPDQPEPPTLTASAELAVPHSSSTILTDETLAVNIARLAAKWRKETGHLSSIERKAIHPAYQAIIATGKRGVPCVLRELKERGGHWFWALHFMSGGVDFGDVSSVQDLRNMWLNWGKQQGYCGL
jgi:hypothetical protein